MTRRDAWLALPTRNREGTWYAWSDLQFAGPRTALRRVPRRQAPVIEVGWRWNAKGGEERALLPTLLPGLVTPETQRGVADPLCDGSAAVAVEGATAGVDGSHSICRTRGSGSNTANSDGSGAQPP